MSYFQPRLVFFLALAFAIAVTPALSVVGWEERYMPNPKLCWYQINKANGCLHQFYASLVNHKINLTQGCCEAIKGLSPKCKVWVFNRGKFTPEFGNQVKGFCATLGITLAPSYHVYFPQRDPSGQLGN